MFSDTNFEPWNSHNPCTFVAALRIQGITPAFGHYFLVYNALFDPYENARTAGICGRRGGGHAPSPFSCFSFVDCPLLRKSAKISSRDPAGAVTLPIRQEATHRLTRGKGRESWLTTRVVNTALSWYTGFRKQAAQITRRRAEYGKRQVVFHP